MVNPLKFLSHLLWLDGKPLEIEPYRQRIFGDVLYSFDPKGQPRFNLALMGREKRTGNRQTSSLPLCIVSWPGPVGVEINATSSPMISTKPTMIWNSRKNSFQAEVPRFENSRNVEMKISRKAVIR
jgi:hypothetical protein